MQQRRGLPMPSTMDLRLRMLRTSPFCGNICMKMNTINRSQLKNSKVSTSVLIFSLSKVSLYDGSQVCLKGMKIVE